MSEPTIRVCAVCGRVLDFKVNAGYQHTTQDRRREDHPPVPVLPGEIQPRYRCDFCNVDEPTMVVPVRTFEVLPGQMSQGDWGACDACGSLIAKNQWSALIKRVMELDPAPVSMPGPVRITALGKLYRAVRAHMTGAPYYEEGTTS